MEVRRAPARNSLERMTDIDPEIRDPEAPHPENTDPGIPHPGQTGSIEVPPESALVKAAAKRAGLTVAQLADATGLSVGAINIALTGVRYRAGGARSAVPTDRTLARLAPALGIQADTLRAYGRHGAAELLGDAPEPARSATDSDAGIREAWAATAARAALADQILAVFSTDELRAEIARRSSR